MSIGNLFLLWLPLVPIAFANGTIRELIFRRYFSEFGAQQLSTLSLIVLSAIYVMRVFKFLQIKDQRQAFWLGFYWLVLTLMFEFTLGRLLNRSWTELLEDYNLLAGHTWPLFLVWIFLLPYLLFTYHSSKKIRSKIFRAKSKST